MRMPALAAAGLVAALALPASGAAGSSGPFVGTLTQGQTVRHDYDNNPTGTPCVDIIARYTVSLTYAPTSDSLTLAAVGKSATGRNGTASINVVQGVCAAFPITVTGTSVAGSAAYTVTVTRDLLGPIT
jgi:hypothetical protein